MNEPLLWETIIYFRFYYGLSKLRLQNCTSRSFLSTLFSLGVASKLFWAAGGVETWLFVSGMEWDASEQMLFTSLCVAFTSSSVIFWLQLPLLLLRWLFWLFFWRKFHSALYLLNYIQDISLGSLLSFIIDLHILEKKWKQGWVKLGVISHMAEIWFRHSFSILKVCVFF